MTAYIAKTIQNKVALFQKLYTYGPFFNLFLTPFLTQKGQKRPFLGQKGPPKRGSKMTAYIAKTIQNKVALFQKLYTYDPFSDPFF